ncbi:MAG: bifunctional phosphopantothenoylcysteine decarboxylase/phosphopantothenate--cysteine ligase CoaBC [Maricaulaceae bacterium]
MAAKRVLLIVGGGIAAYKSLELIRELSRRGIGARAILTRAGAQFVTPLSLAALSGEKVYDDLFSLTDETEMGHIELSRSADLVVVAPATADLMAKAANGHADDLASTALLATDKPVLMAPAMNVRMWEHAATRRNMRTLERDGVRFVGPNEGDMACGEFGFGRMAEPNEIADAVQALLAEGPLAKSRPLDGRAALVTAGPTREPFDPVRYLSNHSSGRQGYAIAEALAHLGARTTLVSGPTALPAPDGVETVRVETAQEMLKACEAALPVDVFFAVAAVADWRPAAPASTKVKKLRAEDGPKIELVENPDILKTLARKRNLRPGLVVGFAAETTDVVTHAKAKLKSKNADWIVANDVSGDVMGGAENEITLVTREGEETWPRMSKDAVAERLALRAAEALG